MENRQIDAYIIQHRMQDGGMSTVYKAIDAHRKQHVVIKVLHERYVSHAEVVERFQREIAIAKELHHTHIVPFYGFGTVDGKPYMALRYMSGGSLSDLIRRQRAIPLRDAAKWLQQVAAALDYAHRRGVIHRDIKPGNVLLDEHNDASLADFGIARLADATKLTRSDMAMPGTVRYMSPEQATGSVPLDARSDVYSLAVLAYMLVVGDYPFDGPNDVSIIIQHVDSKPPRPSSARPDLPRALDKVIMRGMAKKPTQRYDSAGDFAAAFAAAVGEHGDLTTTPRIDAGPVVFSADGSPSRKRRNWTLWALVVASVIALVGMIALGVVVVGALLDDGNTTEQVVIQVSATPAPPTAPVAATVPAVPLASVVQPPTATAVPSNTALPTVTPISPSPTATVPVPNDWFAGTQLFIQYDTGISLFVGDDPVNPAQFAPGDLVTITQGIVEGNARREWFGAPLSRWWHIAVPEGGGGWLPEDALGEDPPLPETMTASAEIRAATATSAATLTPDATDTP
jgi:serine/threonine protein kinase